MANFLGIALLPKKVEYLYLEKKGKSFLLLRRGVFPFADDFSSPANFTHIIQEIKNKEKIPATRLFVTIFRDDVITHQMNLPKMPRADLEEVIAGEIEKAPGFSEKEFEYIWRSYDLEGNRINVIFSAIFKNVLNFVIQGSLATGMRLEKLELAPLNLLSLIYPVTDDKKDQALLVVGEKTNYLLIFLRRQCQFFYTTSTGIVDLYPYGNERLNLLGLINWSDELKRVFKSYLIDHKREKIEKVWLVWDNEAKADLAEALRTELGIDVENFTLSKAGAVSGEGEKNPVALISSAPIVSYIKNYKEELPFNHFLRGLYLKWTIQRTILYTFGYLIAVGLILGRMIFSLDLKREDFVQKYKEIAPQIAVLEKDTSVLKKERAEFLKLKKRLLEQATYVKMLNRISWSRVFGEIATFLPDGVALTSFKISEDGEVEIKGEAFKIDSVAEIMRRIEASYLLSHAKFNSLRERKKDKQRIFTFDITARLVREDESRKK